jgi:hypothetical protein
MVKYYLIKTSLCILSLPTVHHAVTSEEFHADVGQNLLQQLGQILNKLKSIQETKTSIGLGNDIEQYNQLIMLIHTEINDIV